MLSTNNSDELFNNMTYFPERMQLATCPSLWQDSEHNAKQQTQKTDA